MGIDIRTAKPNTTDPAVDWEPVTPNADPMPLAGGTCRAIRAESAGNIKVKTVMQNDRVMKFKAGETRPVLATHIWQTGTTVAAGDIEVAY